MAFKKTGISISKPVQVDLAPEIGDVREDGMVWDGEKWAPAPSTEESEPASEMPSPSVPG